MRSIKYSFRCDDTALNEWLIEQSIIRSGPYSWQRPIGISGVVLKALRSLKESQDRTKAAKPTSTSDKPARSSGAVRQKPDQASVRQPPGQRRTPAASKRKRGGK